MKRQFFIIRKLVAGLFIATILFSGAASAKPKSKAASTQSFQAEPAVDVITTDGQSTTLNINFAAEASVKFDLVVDDANGDRIYSQQFEAATFNKFIKLVREGNLSAEAFYITIRLADGSKYNFKITNEQTLIKQMQVTKM